MPPAAPANAGKPELPDVDTNPFKMAAVGNLALLKSLVEPPEGSSAMPLNVNATDQFGCTVLAWAARNGYVKVMDMLAAHGADVEVPGFGGLRALHHATNHSRLPVVARLLELGASVDAKDDAKDDAGNTPLHFAASRGILNPTLLLLNASAKVDALTSQEVTPLMKAASAGHVTAVEKLLDHDANPNLANSEGNTARSPSSSSCCWTRARPPRRATSRARRPRTSPARLTSPRCSTRELRRDMQCGVHNTMTFPVLIYVLCRVVV